MDYVYNKYDSCSSRGLYEMLAFWQGDLMTRYHRERPEAAEHVAKVIIELKQAIRRRNNKPASNILTSWQTAFDSWVEVVKCPAWVECAEDAEEFFFEDLDLPPIYSAYDCTGRTFVYRHKVGLRSGQWVVYVFKGSDV